MVQATTGFTRRSWGRTASLLSLCVFLISLGVFLISGAATAVTAQARFNVPVEYFTLPNGL
ncbi:MAG: hypothetical protein ACREUC_21380 [Steroidobacteraceae bacterium]